MPSFRAPNNTQRIGHIRKSMLFGLASLLVLLLACISSNAAVTQPATVAVASRTPRPTLDAADLSGDWRAVLADEVTLEFQVKDGLVTFYNVIYDVTTSSGCRIDGHKEELIEAPIIDGKFEAEPRVPDPGFSFSGFFFASDRASGSITMKPMTTGCGGVNLEIGLWHAEKISSP